MHRNKAAWVLALLSALALVAARTHAQTEAKYLTPPKVIIDILDANPIPQTIVRASRQQIAIVERKSMPTIADLAQPMLRLAGVRINPKTNGTRRVSGVVYAVTLKKIADGKEVKVRVPPAANIGSLSFSPDGRHLAFTQTTECSISPFPVEPADPMLYT